MEYLNNPLLKTIKEDWKGNPFSDGRFQYVDQPFYNSYKKLLRWQLGGNPQRKEKRQDKWRASICDDYSVLNSKDDFIIWLGHASFLIQLNGIRLITDPVFYNLAILQRTIPLPFPVERIKKVDYLLLSHDHRDHCDKRSIQNLLKFNQPNILTPLKLTGVIKPWVGNTPIQEAAWYQVYKTEDKNLEITFLPSQHWCRRGLTDFNKRLWGSFMIQSGDKTIYFGGDSGMGPHFRAIGNTFVDIDYALLGIGAYAPPFMMQEIHTSPEEAMTAFQHLGAQKMIPMHYATYDLSDEPISEPYHRIQYAFEQKGIIDQLCLLEPGALFKL